MRGCNGDGMRHGHMDEQGKWKMKLTERRTTQALTGEGRTEREREAEMRRKEEIQTCC